MSRRTPPYHAGEVYFEIRQIGQYLRVNAIDAHTGVEVTVSGPVTVHSESVLKDLALKKLHYRLQKSGQTT